MKIKYIGLDISTSIIGICLLSQDHNLIDLNYIDLRKTKCIFEKSRKVKEFLCDIKEKNKFEEETIISIEESFQSFRSGFSSAKTISQLNRFNGIVSFITSEVFNIDPIYINVNSARKNLKISINKKLDISTKEQIYNWVCKNFNELNIDFKWPTKVLKSGINKGNVKLLDSCYDMADAYVICKAIEFYEKQK